MTHHALHEMKNWLRIKKHRENGLFKDHTDLITYLDKVEKEMKEIDEHDQYGNEKSYFHIYEAPFTLFVILSWIFYEVKSKLFKKQ